MNFTLTATTTMNDAKLKQPNELELNAAEWSKATMKSENKKQQRLNKQKINQSKKNKRNCKMQRTCFGFGERRKHCPRSLDGVDNEIFTFERNLIPNVKYIVHR